MCSDFNGDVGSDMGGFGVVHGGFWIVQINDGGIRGEETCCWD